MEETEVAKRAENEVGFVSFVAGPFWQALAATIPPELEKVIEQVDVNKTEWVAIKDGAAPPDLLPIAYKNSSYTAAVACCGVETAAATAAAVE